MKLEHINNILDGLVGDVEVLRLAGRRDRVTYYMHCYTNGREEFNLKLEDGIDKLIKIGWELKSPEWVNITTVCIDMIGKELWVDKMKPIIVETVAMGTDYTNIVSTDGDIYEADDLWMKE